MIRIFGDHRRGKAVKSVQSDLVRAVADGVPQFCPHGFYAGVGVGDGQDAVRRRIGLPQDVGDAQGQDRCLARTGTGDDHDGAVDGVDCFALGGVEGRIFFLKSLLGRAVRQSVRHLDILAWRGRDKKKTAQATFLKNGVRG